jgi:hypothetical protein
MPVRQPEIRARGVAKPCRDLLGRNRGALPRLRGRGEQGESAMRCSSAGSALSSANGVGMRDLLDVGWWSKVSRRLRNSAHNLK